MVVISIIYIFMIKRRKYIILDLSALVGMISYARTWCLSAKVAGAARLLLGRMGVGSPPTPAEVLTDPHF